MPPDMRMNRVIKIIRVSIVRQSPIYLGSDGPSGQGLFNNRSGSAAMKDSDLEHVGSRRSTQTPTHRALSSPGAVKWE